ncbi:HPr kinase/phosphatase C-terminal domain-containing protein [Hyphomicrobium sp. CS1GBMeth3]|uniref:HPr kinase/phosphorylase n=1 Tax=Hyphomicrobium sp. CS1GBMeth3 TaxID=1892845 RepID=UPI0009311F68|nr:HPr kinase/phosphatase C-terminal domain-containing protein [Hyphomicrobium sp. CS1GBMeth3]
MSPSPSATELVHATALALGDKAVLIRGPSGSGKSDLTLRCIALPPLAHSPLRAELVADDQVQCVRREDGLVVSPPATLAGKIEVRGLGILTLTYRPSARLALVVDLVASEAVERYPLESLTAEYLGIVLPVVRLAPFEASAPVKLILALEAAPGTLTAP